MATRRIGRSRYLVARFVAANAGKLALFLLPPYSSPGLNPDEYVWNELKAHGTGRSSSPR